MRKILHSRVAAVSVGAAVLVGFGATGAVAANMIDSSDIRNGSVHAADIARGAVGSNEINNNSVDAQDIVRNSIGDSELKPNSVGADQLTGWASNRITAVNGLPQRVSALEDAAAASEDLGALANKGANDPAQRVTLQAIGGTVLNKSEGLGATELTSIDLEAGTYLVSAYGHFDRLGDTEPGYVAPTTDTYGALVLWTGASDAAFTDFSQAAGTYITGAISPKGFVEATASGSQVLELTEPTTLHVGGFGYNENRSGFGTGTGQFSAIANVSAVKVG
jgi:hypothetical protein